MTGHPARRFFDPTAVRLPTGAAIGWRHIETLRPQLGERATNALLRNGYTAEAQVEAATDDELTARRGIGDSVLAAIRRVIPHNPARRYVQQPPQPEQLTAAERRRRRLESMPADKHGTAVGYEYWGCRNSCCTEAARRRWERYPHTSRPSWRGRA